jgi:hypothetical protein
MEPDAYTYPRYLRSKRTVDDRALNRDVMESVFARLPDARPVRIAELGGGVGTMVDRLIDEGRVPQADYTLVDAERGFLDEADSLRATWKRGGSRRDPSATDGTSFDVALNHARLESWVADGTDLYDLIIAHAVLDLVDVASFLPTLLGRLSPGGTFWTTINFDGDTIFMPRDPRDQRLMDAYHRSMDEREHDGRPAGSSTAGRELFEHVRAAGGRVLRAGSSDWVVHGTSEGYEADEAYFVHHIIHTVENELGPTALGDDVRDWGAIRHAQVEAGALVYIAHQLDFAIVSG